MSDKITTVSSPLYPHNYPNTINCFWFVSSTENYIIITILYLEINEDVLRFGIGSRSDRDGMIMEITGYNVQPNSLTVDSPVCWINMETNEEFNYRGFTLALKSQSQFGKL